jgi:hypothetical protein
MIRSLVLAVSSLLFSSAAVCQAPACPEAQTLQSLLTEVHQLRQDLQTVSVAARKAQILIYRLYVQEAIVRQVSENLNNTKTALNDMRIGREYQAEQVKQYEEARDRSDDPTHRKRMDDMIAQMKSPFEAANSDEQELQAQEMELEENCGRSAQSLNKNRPSSTN